MNEINEESNFIILWGQRGWRHIHKREGLLEMKIVVSRIKYGEMILTVAWTNLDH